MSIRAAATLAFALSLAAPTARADPPARHGRTAARGAQGLGHALRADRGVPEEIVDARRELASYDVHGGTARTLHDLSTFIARTLRGPNQREARYLRAVAATDLLLIAHSHRDASISREVASALGLAPEALMGALDLELAELEVGAYAEVVRECRWALSILQRGAAEPATLRDGAGQRRDVLFMSAVVDALGQPDEMARLARLGAEPCVTQTCPLRAFTSEGRRAVSALREANAALGRLEHVAQGGDPFAASLASLVAVDGAVLRTTELSPPPSLPVELGTHAGDGGQPMRAQLVLVVRPSTIEYAYVPSVRVRDGAFELVSDGEPALPNFASIRFADDGRTGVAPYDALEPQLAALRAPLGAHARVGITASDEVPSLTVSRLILTMLRADFAAPELVARGTDGQARSVPIEVVLGEDADTELALFVRMGGYTLHRGRSSLDIPRVRDASGLRFDVDALERNAAHASRSALRYMGVVAWSTVLDAAFRLRTESAPLSLVLY